MNKTIIYGIIIICVTQILIMILWASQQQEEQKADLIIECIYAYSDSEGSAVDKCIRDVNKVTGQKP